MLQNPIYHSTSFPQFYPRVAGPPNFSFESSPDSQTLPTHVRAPHSPYNLRPLPSKYYHNQNPLLSSLLILSSIPNCTTCQTLAELSYV